MAEFFDRVSEAVARIESGSSVWLVVVASTQTGNYGDIQHLVAFCGSLLCLLFLIYSPWEFDTDWFAIWMALSYLLTVALVRRFPVLWRPLIPSARRLAQAYQQARAAFVEERVGSTRERTGILLYICPAERLALLVTDLGVDSAVPRALFNDFQARLASCRSQTEFEDGLLKQMETLVQPLAEHLPAREDDTNELSNQVRVRM